MRKFHLSGCAVFAVLAFSAVAASSATATVCVNVGANKGLYMKRSATGVCEENLGALDGEFELWSFLLAEWLWEGSALSSALLAESPGELLLEDTKGGLLGEGVAILCSGISEDFMEPNSRALLTEVLDLRGNAISKTPLVEPGLACEDQSGGKCVEPLVWADNLPWSKELELLEDEHGNFVYIVLVLSGGNGNPGWYIECMLTLGAPTDLCEAAEGAFEVVNNVGGTPTALASDAIQELAGLSLGTCTRGGTGTGTGEGEGLIEHSTGGSISVSSI